MLNECVAAFGNYGGRRMLVKNRDKSYKPSLDFYHELRDGTEMLYYIDEAVNHLEGMNEHGVGVVYTTSNFQEDNADMMSDNVYTILQALASESAEGAIQPLLEQRGGVHGLVFLSGPDGTYLIEHDVNSDNSKVGRVNTQEGWNVVTNSPTMLQGGIDPQAGEDYISCQIRKAVAEAALSGIDNVDEALTALAYKYFDDQSHHNPMRDSEFETTCAQIGMDLEDKVCYFTPVPNALASKSFTNNLPDDYEPKIEYVERKLDEPTIAPFRLFTTNLDEGVSRFNLVNYLLDDGPETDLEELEDQLKDRVAGASRLDLAQQAADELWEKERILVSLVRKMERDPVFFTAGHTSSQVQSEVELLQKMIEKIGEDYKHLLDIMHIEKYGTPMPGLDEAKKKKKSRSPRKKGQHQNSPNHSDLFTNENPEGDIKGLGFKDAETAEKGVAKVNSADRTHAHKVQATLVMKQRGKEVIKRTKDPEKKKDLRAANKIWSAHLEKLKKKTKKMKESPELREYVRSIIARD